MYDKKEKFDTMIFAGDYAYEFWTDNGEVGDKFLEELEKFDTKWPLMFSPGNHEDNFNF